jgi:hypothetical protein
MAKVNLKMNLPKVVAHHIKKSWPAYLHGGAVIEGSRGLSESDTPGQAQPEDCIPK